MKPWFYNEQSITEFKEPVVYKGLEINVRKTNIKPPYIATVKSPATGKEVIQKGGNTEQEALDSAKQAVDKREADAPKISAGGQTSVLLNTPSNDELLKDPSMYNMIYAKISKDRNGPTLVIGNEVYGRADLEADGFVGSYDRRTKRGKDSEETLPQVMFNASNKLLSQIGIKMNGRYTIDTSGKYKDDNEHTVYPLQFQGSTVHAGDRLRMSRPALTIGATREDAQPWFQRELEEAEIIKFPEPKAKVIELPNVQSYPDFLTGVKDLHNRKAQGEISQDSHDRLYSDLINRFMKKESFETPWFLREQKGQCNRGHAMELHIAIAIYMRLQSKNDIDINSLKNKIISLSTSTKIKEETTIKGDTYILEASVTSDVINCSRQPKIYEPGGLFRPNIERALAVANQQVKKQIEFIHNNQRKDNVEIRAVGTQGGKVDLAVAVKFEENGQIITQSLSDLTYSLKVKSKEFGQTKINSPQVLLRGFTKMFTDLGFPKTFDRVGKPIIEKLLKNKRYIKLFDDFAKIGRPRHDLKAGTGPEGSEMAIELNSIVKPVMQNLYKAMAVEMTKQFKRKGGEQKEFEVLANFLLNELADGGDMSVLQFNEKSYTILTASSLEELKKFVKDNIELEVRFSIGKGGVDPYFDFVNTVDNEILFRIRFTADGKHVMKNPYQQGPGLEKYKTKFDY